MLKIFISNIKHKALIVMGTVLIVVSAAILTYSAWKFLFYFEAASYGEKLTQDLRQSLQEGTFGIASFSEKARNDYHLTTLDFFPREFDSSFLQNKQASNCQAMTDVHAFANFSASVTCTFDDKPVYYHFRKDYDHPFYLMLILGVAIITTYRIIISVDRLRQENFTKTLELTREKAVFEVGAKLVHDLKKGVLSQLNALADEYGEDLALEMKQPDFNQRLEAKLGEHFKAIDFLNKYMSLLMVNLKRQPELHWINLDSRSLTNYVRAVFSPTTLNTQPKSKGVLGSQLTFNSADRSADIAFGENGFSFWVPEMSFFRILKNISENYNAYGQGKLVLNISPDLENLKVKMTAKNAVLPSPQKTSTGLGLTIIKQLIIDNFGADTSVDIFNDEKNYSLTLSFPLIKEKESIPHGQINISHSVL